MPMVTKWEPRLGEEVIIKKGDCITTDGGSGGTAILNSRPPFAIRVIKTFYDYETGDIVHGHVLDTKVAIAIAKEAGWSNPKLIGEAGVTVKFHADDVDVEMPS